MEGHLEHPDVPARSELPAGLGLSEALPLLFSAARTGRLSAHEVELPPLDVWLEQGRVMHATWGSLRALSALEMAALLPPRVACEFVEGEHAPSHTLDLSAIDVAARLAEVARAGGQLAAAIPGIEAVPRRTDHRPRALDPDAARMLEQVDGTRTVADLTSGRQPLAVVRALASLVAQGVVTFTLAAEPAEVVAYVAPVPEPAPEPQPEPVPDPEPEPDVGAHVIPMTVPVPLPVETETRQIDTRQRFPRVNVGLATLALVIAVALWFAVQRMQTQTQTQASVAGVQATAVASATPIGAGAVAAAPVVTATPLPATAPPTPVPATPVPTSPPAATTAPTPLAVASVAPTTAPTIAPTTVPTIPPTAAPSIAPTTAPTVAPTTPPTVAPTTAPTETATSAPVATPATVTAAASASPAAPVLDETFASGADGWPNAATASAFWDTSGYHLVPRIAAQFVAITAPSSSALSDGLVTGQFRKIAGPVGGGYGLILRAQAPLDGADQGGRYYVFEVGDKGEVGAWRREQDQWIDLMPWQASGAVNAGDAENRLQVRAAGAQFTFSVNDSQVVQVSDATLTSGAVGVFTGGDGNQVVLERFTVANP